MGSVKTEPLETSEPSGAPRSIYEQLIVKNQTFFKTGADFEKAFTYERILFICAGRLALINDGIVEKEDVITLACGELFGPLLPETYHLSSKEADEEIFKVLKALYDKKIMLHGFSEMVSQFKNEFSTWNITAAKRLFKNSAQVKGGIVLGGPTLVITHAVLAMCQKGNISETFANQLMVAFQKDMGIVIDVNKSIVSKIFSKYGSSMTEATAEIYLNYFTKLIPENCFVLLKIVKDTSWCGLKPYQTIIKAVDRHSDFPWHEIAKLLATDWKNFIWIAHSINDNPFMGFKKELKQLSYLNCQFLYYVAERLVVPFENHIEPPQAMDWMDRFYNRSKIDTIICNYLKYGSTGITGHVPGGFEVEIAYLKTREY